jgi:PAS domain S-box-containing protein
MKDSSNANQELLEENSFLNKRIKELEQAESDCKRLDEALRERDIKFKRFFSLVSGMIFQFTKRPDGTYCLPFATEAIRDLYGCSPEDVYDDFSPIVRVILPEDLDKLMDSIVYSAKHMTNWTCEYRVQIPGKSIKWTLGNSTPEKLADGSITWYGYNTDITDYKRIEAELRKSQEIFTQFMENSPIYIFFKDDNIRAIQLSRNYEKMLGRPLHELLGKNMYDLFPSDLAKAMVAEDLRILNEGKQVTVKEELNGRFYSTVKFPINFEGKACYLVGYTIDVTESKQAEAERLVLEERLNRAEKMEALGTLGGVAHDLNNVLALSSVMRNCS